MLIEVSASQMSWRVINPAKSACLVITMQDKLFDHFVLYQQDTLQTSVLLKVCIEQSALHDQCACARGS